MCLYPKLIKNKKYTRTEKNGGEIPAVTDPRVQYVPRKCGNCIECRKQKAREWLIRLMEDIQTNKNGKFITLTFTNESIKHLTEKAYEYNEKRISTHLHDQGYKAQNKRPKLLKGYTLDNEIATVAIRLFNERWRKKYGKAIRHWLVTELGHNGTENIHLHGIIWTDETYETIANIWQYGYIWPRPNEPVKTWVNEQTVNYITKYITKKDEKNTQYTSIILTSPGIGSAYTHRHTSRNNRFRDKDTNETYRTRTGHKINLPIYWRNKLYTEEEREKLWINKLDKETRYICGEKISIKNGEENYNRTLEYYQKLNKELGYGTDEKNWKKLAYENYRREIAIQTRIQKAANAQQKIVPPSPQEMG